MKFHFQMTCFRNFVNFKLLPISTLLDVRFENESTASVPGTQTVLHDPEQFYHEEDAECCEEKST